MIAHKHILARSRCIPYHKPNKIVRMVKMKSNPLDVSYYVGKSIILFTLFYCGMNWYHYKELREENEKDDEK
jgi:hypothetical protein